MTKIEFLSHLENKLNSLPENEIKKTIDFYSEIIDDRIEDGLNEDDAVAALGNLNELVNTTLLDAPLTTLMKAKIKPKKRLKAWEIVLIILGFPLWFPLLIGFFAVILGVYVSIWAIIISLYVTVASFILGGIASVFILFFSQSFPAGLFAFGCSLCLIGLGALLFFPVKKLSIWLIQITGLFLRWIKSLFINKEVL
jgi:uncharacterized membrane protein